MKREKRSAEGLGLAGTRTQNQRLKRASIMLGRLIYLPDTCHLESLFGVIRNHSHL